MAIPYISGLSVKPLSISGLGVVTFTDGTNEVQPNQLQCEAYGYTYDKASGTCSIFRYNTNLNRSFDNINNSIQGSQNFTETGTNNTLIMGESNTVRGFSRNNIITGSGNEIANGINNAKVSGIMGKAVRQGEDVLGGGSYNIGAGYTQSSKIQLSSKTTDETLTNLYVQDIVGEYITLQRNSILGYEIYITKLETGGTSGNVGDFSYRVQRGVVKCDNVGAITIITHSTKTIGKIGHNGAFSVIDSTVGSVPSVTIQVQGLADVNNLWSATAYLHELATNIAI
tara:strand:+ start:565 stop:1416 length:852 start_codon:yes stop_codon:yes gene_type:complete